MCLPVNDTKDAQNISSRGTCGDSASSHRAVFILTSVVHGRELLWDSIRGTPRGWAGSGAWTLPLQPGEPADFGFSLHHVLGLRDPVSHFCVRNTKRMDAGRQPACRVWQVWGLLMMMEHPCDLVPCGEMGQGLFSTCWSFFIVQYQEKIPLPAYLWPPTLGFFWRIF